MKRHGQTFALVNLIEVVLALLVLALVGIGMMTLVLGTNYYHKFFAKDNAHLIETLHAVPNGEVTVGYLWANPGYEISVERDHVTVTKKARELGGLVQGTFVGKAFGTGRSTVVTPATFEPRYFLYSATGAPMRTITANGQFALRGCPDAPPPGGISKAGYGFPSTDSIGESIADQMIARIRAQGWLSTGITVAVVYEPAVQPELLVYDSSANPTSARLACVFEREIQFSDYSARRSSLGQSPSAVRAMKADVIVLVRGPPGDRDRIATLLADAALKYSVNTQPGVAP